MRVIIAGAGEVGRGVAAALRGEKRGVAMIDPDPNAISDSQSLDCLLITGSALSRDSLVRAGINDAEIIAVAYISSPHKCPSRVVVENCVFEVQNFLSPLEKT